MMATWFLHIFIVTNLLPFRVSLSKVNVPRRNSLSDLPLIMSADKTRQILRNLLEDHFNLTSLESAVKDMKFSYDEVDQKANFKKAIAHVAKKLNAFKDALNKTSNEVLKSYRIAPFDVQVFKKFQECCVFDKRMLKYDVLMSSRINSSDTCEIVPRNLSPFAFHPRTELFKVYEINSRQSHLSTAWQYFVSIDGLHIEYPAHHLDDNDVNGCIRKEKDRHKSIYIKATLSYRKKIVILIDRGNVMSQNQIDAAKCVAKTIIGSLDSEDEIAVVLIGHEITIAPKLRCSHKNLVPVVHDVKEHLMHFIDSIRRSSGHTNHSLGFSTAFDILASLKVEENARYLILYLSRGMFSQLSDGAAVMATIAEANSRLANRVQVNTVALLDGAKAVMWETTFLGDVAAQNFQRYSNSFSPQLLKLIKQKLKPPEGKMITVNSTADQCIGLKELYETLKPSGFGLNEPDSLGGASSSFRYVLDRLGDSDILSIAKPVVHQDDHLLGVVGIDVNLKQLIAPVVTFVSNDPLTYAFLVDSYRQIIYHPKFYKLGDKETLKFMDFESIEKDFPYLTMISSLYSEGVEVSNVVINETGSMKPRRFFWKKIADTMLYAVLVTTNNLDLINDAHKPARKFVSTSHLTYHRIDLPVSKDVKACLQGKAIFNTEKCGLYLTPKCFEKSYERSLIAEELRVAQGYWAYITDHTKLITNPGLKNERLRNDIAEWSNLARFWCQNSAKWNQMRYPFVRKYLATSTGLLFTYPAFRIHQTFDPMHRHWFQQAVESAPGTIVLSQPYLDPSGVGYVVPVSVALKPVNTVVAVLAIDVPLTWLHKILNAELSICAGASQPAQTDCLLFNQRGYVVAHRNIFASTDSDASVSQIFEQMHLTHKEASLAADVLQNKQFVRKSLCHDVAVGQMQRYFNFNTSSSDVQRSSPGTDTCHQRHQVVLVPGTNTFLAALNRSCGRQSAFCPCSVLDRKCLNCLRSEPTECECPCECSLSKTKFTFCGDDSFDFDPAKYPICEQMQESVKSFIANDVLYAVSQSSILPSCFVWNCIQFGSENECIKFPGCEWCSHYEDFKSPLKTPFCSTLNQCYGGILGLSAYGALERAYTLSDQLPVSSTPVGPVAGGIMVAFVVLVLAVFWYRRKVARFVEAARAHGRYGAAGGSGSRLNAEDEAEDYDFGDDCAPGNNAESCENTGTTCLLLTSFERANLAATSAAPSSIRPRPFWRRGPRTESSDPGYSTMTGGAATTNGGDGESSEKATTVVGGGRGHQRPPAAPLSDWSSSGLESSDDQQLRRAPRRSDAAPDAEKLGDDVMSETTQITSHDDTILENSDNSAPSDNQTVLEAPMTDIIHERRVLVTKAIIHAVDA